MRGARPIVVDDVSPLALLVDRPSMQLTADRQVRRQEDVDRRLQQDARRLRAHLARQALAGARGPDVEVVADHDLTHRSQARGRRRWRRALRRRCVTGRRRVLLGRRRLALLRRCLVALLRRLVALLRRLLGARDARERSVNATAARDAADRHRGPPRRYHSVADESRPRSGGPPVSRAPRPQAPPQTTATGVSGATAPRTPRRPRPRLRCARAALGRGIENLLSREPLPEPFERIVRRRQRRLDQRRAAARAGARHRRLRRRVHREQVVSVDAHAGQSVGERLDRDGLGHRLDGGRPRRARR